jgi:hypothetical protein
VLAAFFRVPLAVHEREFVKASGSLSVPLTGLNIKQYLTYLLVEHSHAINLYSCREFCGFFKRTLDDETSIRYRDIVTLIKERNSGVNHAQLFVSPQHLLLNPYHFLVVAWTKFMRLVALYHILNVPVRIAFQSEANTMTSLQPLATDLPADTLILLHLLLSVNVSYKNTKNQERNNYLCSDAFLLVPALGGRAQVPSHVSVHVCVHANMRPLRSGS